MPTEPSPTWARSLRTVTTTLAAALAATASLVAATIVPADGARPPTVTCRYTFTAWPTGFSADIAMTNSGPSIDGWTVHWTFTTPTQATTAWSAQLTQSSPVDIVATPAAWNRVIPAGSTLSFGWTGIAARTEVPTDLSVNGQRC